MSIDSLVVVLFYLCIPWALLELASRLQQHYFNRAGSAILIARRRLATSVNTKDKDRNLTWISRGPLWIKIETVRLNALPSRILQQWDRLWLRSDDLRGFNHQHDGNDGDGNRTRLHSEYNGTKKYNSRVTRNLEYFYDLGIIFAGVAFFASIAFLIWGAFDLVGQISELGSIVKSSSTTMLKKRELEETSGNNVSRSGWSPSLVPLIPGLTLPLSHIVPLVLALSFTQVLHEAGHAICGTIHCWTPLRTGLVLLFPCIPGAFVILPQEAVESDDEEEEDEEGSDYVNEDTVNSASITRKRLRTISAGVWHNALTALVLAILVFSGLSSVFHQVFWREVDGMMVESVDISSPLFQHMPTGTLIAQLNDYDLTSKSSLINTPHDRQKAWENLLLEDKLSKVDPLGWCVPNSIWQARSTTCCDSIGTSETVQDHGQESLCFQEFVGDSSTSIGRCFNPVNLVSTKLEGERCRGSCPNDDRTGQKRNCILADEREQLVRITIIQTGQTSTRVVLFQGTTESIYSALTVSSFTFRINWFPLPYHVFQWWTLLVTYILNLSLAMAILNMLPLPSLDGDVYFQFMLKTLISRYHTTDDEISTTNRQDNRDEEENINGIELGAMVTSRPESPTQLRRPSSTNKFAFDGSQQSRYRQSNTLAQSSHRLSQNRVLTKIHQRLQWVTIFFAVFVFGGSILLHAVKEVE